MSDSEIDSDSESVDDEDSYDDWVGRVLDDRYRIDGLLGEGGMGAVFEAEHLKLMKKVAVKVIHPEFAGDGDVAKRFAREAMASARLEHPHVASATDYGTLPEGGAYLVMQFVRGRSLRDVIAEEGALGWARACEVGVQVSDALSAAHKEGIVHRDLKPDNVMLEPRDDGSHLVKVLDFGIARVADGAVSTSGHALTRVGTVIGTPGYMAPEQALGETVDYRADLYALGLVLFEMTSGKQLFDGKDLTAIVTRQLTEDPPRLSEVMSEVPRALDDLVERMLSRERDARPESAAEVRTVLRDLLLQAVGSKETNLSIIGTTELGGAARMSESQEDSPSPIQVSAPTMAASPSGRSSREAAPVTRPAEAVPRPAVPTRAGGGDVSTSIALERAKRSLRGSRVRGPLVGLGCLGVAFVSVVALSSSLLGGGSDLAKLTKEEHDRPMMILPDEVEQTEERGGRIPPALSQAYFDLSQSDDDDVREDAAALVLAHEPAEEVPELLHALATLEDESSCNGKLEQVQRLMGLRDQRALPTLERMHTARPRCMRGRGFMRRSYDCYYCMRRELGEAVETLRSVE